MGKTSRAATAHHVVGIFSLWSDAAIAADRLRAYGIEDHHVHLVGPCAPGTRRTSAEARFLERYASVLEQDRCIVVARAADEHEAQAVRSLLRAAGAEGDAAAA